MTKKRKMSSYTPVKIEVKEENVGGNDYLMAKSRLKGVLKQITEQSDSDSDSSEASNYTPKKTETRKRKITPPMPVHHTYVMKLFDRSVDLARFEEDTPLYPICRAWMANLPRNPQVIVKRRLSSPEPDNSWIGNNVTEVSRLPRPNVSHQTRSTVPLPAQMNQDKNDINLNYDEKPPVPRDVLIRNHLQRWVDVKRKWIDTAHQNEERYARSMQILQAIYNKAQEALE